MIRFDFSCDIKANLVNGDTQMFYGFEVAVETWDMDDAANSVKDIAAEMLHDAGSRLLDAPLEDIELIRVEML